jgi:hypothetical protein
LPGVDENNSGEGECVDEEEVQKLKKRTGDK